MTTQTPTERALAVVVEAVAINAHAGTIASEIVTRAQVIHAAGDDDHLRDALYATARAIMARARAHDAARERAAYHALHPVTQIAYQWAGMVPAGVAP